VKHLVVLVERLEEARAVRGLEVEPTPNPLGELQHHRGLPARVAVREHDDRPFGAPGGELLVEHMDVLEERLARLDAGHGVRDDAVRA